MMKLITQIRLVVILFTVTLTMVDCFAGNVDEERFNLCSTLNGRKYIEFKKMLLKEGSALKPMLKNKLMSKDLNQRFLAEILLMQLDKPTKVKSLQRCYRDLENIDLDDFIDEVDLSKEVEFHVSSYMKVRTLNLDYREAYPKAQLVPDCVTVDLFKIAGEDWNVESTLQFSLFPSEEVASIMWSGVEPLRRDAELLYREGLVCLGKHPRYLQTLKTVLTHLDSLKKDKSLKLTRKETKELQTQFNLSLFVLSRLKDDQAQDIMLKILYHPNNNFGTKRILEALAYSGTEQNLAHLVHFFLKTQKSDKDDYWKIRYWIIKHYGVKAVPYLEKIVDKTPDKKKVLIKGLIAAIDGADTKQNRIAKLREMLCFAKLHRMFFLLSTGDLLMELHSLTGEPVAARIGKTIIHPLKMKHKIKKIKLIGQLRDPEGLPFILSFIPDPFDEYADYVETTTRSIITDLAILAMVDIGGDEAKKMLKKISKYPDFTVIAESMLLAMDKNIAELKYRLTDKLVDVRESAVLALWKLNDPSVTPLLLRATARRHGSHFTMWKEFADTAVNLKPALLEMAKHGTVREKVLASYMLFEQEDTEKVKLYHKRLRGYNTHGIESAALPTFHDAKSEAMDLVILPGEKHVPEVEIIFPGSEPFPVDEEWRKIRNIKLDDSFIPFFEYTAVFDGSYFYRGAAAFALAKFKQKSSIPALVESLTTEPGPRFVKEALLEFGKDGSEAVSKIEVPSSESLTINQDQAAHLAAVYVMSKNGDPRGVDHIISGIKLFMQNPKLSVKGYIDAAPLYHDDRLVEPLISVLKTTKDSTLKSQVISILGKYNKPELAELYLTQLRVSIIKTKADAKKTYKHFTQYPSFLPQQSFNPAVRELTKIHKDKIFDYLENKYQSSDVETKCGIIQALANLSRISNEREFGISDDSGVSLSRLKKFLDTGDPKLSPCKLQLDVDSLRNKTYSFFIQCLNDKNENIALKASIALAMWGQGTKYKHPVYKSKYSWKDGDCKAVTVLNDWIEQKEIRLIRDSHLKYLAHWGNKRSGELIFKLYKEGNNSYKVLEYLEIIRPEGAVEFLYEKLLKNDKYVRIDNLKYMGDNGIKALVKILRNGDLSSYRKERIARALLETRERYKPKKYEIPEKLYHDKVVPAVANTVIELIDRAKKGVPFSEKQQTSQQDAEDYRYDIRSLIDYLDDVSPEEAKHLAEYILKVDYPTTLVPWAKKLSTQK